MYAASYSYKNYVMILCLMMTIMGMCMFILKEADLSRRLPEDIFNMTLQEANMEIREKASQKPSMVSDVSPGIKAEPVTDGDKTKTAEEQEIKPVITSISIDQNTTSSSRRMVFYDVLVNEKAVFLQEEDYEVLCRIVEAEAGNEDEKGRMLVARVVLNRVESSRFPNNVKEVVFQKSDGTCQFSPVSNGSYYAVSVSEKTRNAVDKVLRGADDSCGALYFINRKAAYAEYVNWFDTKCTRLFAHGNHEFFS